MAATIKVKKGAYVCAVSGASIVLSQNAWVVTAPEYAGHRPVESFGTLAEALASCEGVPESAYAVKVTVERWAVALRRERENAEADRLGRWLDRHA